MNKRVQRCLGAIKLRETKTLKDVGKALGVSPQRARDICFRGSRYKKILEGGTDFEKVLIGRTKEHTALTNAYGKSVSPDDVANGGPTVFMHEKYCGPKTLRGIAECLKEVGVIEDIDKWLEGK